MSHQGSPLSIYNSLNCSKGKKAGVGRREWMTYLPANAGSVPGLGRLPGVGNGNPFQYSCFENSMDRGAWQAIVHEVTKSWTCTRMHTHTHPITSTVRDHPTIHISYSCNNRTQPMKQMTNLQAQPPPPSPTCTRGLWYPVKVVPTLNNYAIQIIPA